MQSLFAIDYVYSVYCHGSLRECLISGENDSKSRLSLNHLQYKVEFRAVAEEWTQFKVQRNAIVEFQLPWTRQKATQTQSNMMQAARDRDGSFILNGFVHNRRHLHRTRWQVEEKRVTPPANMATVLIPRFYWPVACKRDKGRLETWHMWHAVTCYTSQRAVTRRNTQTMIEHTQRDGRCRHRTTAITLPNTVKRSIQQYGGHQTARWPWWQNHFSIRAAFSELN